MVHINKKEKTKSRKRGVKVLWVLFLCLVFVGGTMFGVGSFAERTPVYAEEPSMENALEAAEDAQEQARATAYVEAVGEDRAGMTNATDAEKYVNPTPQKRYITEEIKFPATSGSATKTYESYTAITNRASLNYQLLHGDNVTMEEDGLVNVGGFYAIAIGQKFGDVGDKLIITLKNEDGTTHKVKCIICDSKSNGHTQGGGGWFGSGGHIIEVIVNTENLDGGPQFYGNMNVNEKFHGTVEKVEKVLGEETYYIPGK